MSNKLRPIRVEGNKYYTRLSFDIDDFIGDGVWWLEVYDDQRNLVYDKAFASNTGTLDRRRVREIIKEQFLTLKGELL